MTRSVRRTRRTLQVAGASVAALLALSACSSSGDDSSATTKSDTSAAATPKLSGSITVFAAASLQESFTILKADFEKAHPGTKVNFSFGGSDTLAAQITSGAPADVFAAASPKTMAIVTDKKDTATTPPPSSATSWRSPPCRASRPASPRPTRSQLVAHSATHIAAPC